MKRLYNDVINMTQLEIESDVLHVMFHNEKPECFDDMTTQIKKLPHHQLWGDTHKTSILRGC